MKSDIPKIIHYCWFGKGKKSKIIKKCMKTWNKYMPDYRIIEWNEENFNINCNQYVKQAYDNKKYAFVSDYARLYALYNYGGIYFDTDIEVVKNLDKYLENKDVYGFEKKDIIMTGVMISVKNSAIIKRFLDIYDKINFIEEDGTVNDLPNTCRFTEILKEYGLNCNNERQVLKDIADIYPLEYFCAYDTDNSHFIPSEKTLTIHHYNGSWTSKKDRLESKIKRIISKILGVKIYDKIRRIKNKIENSYKSDKI